MTSPLPHEGALPPDMDDEERAYLHFARDIVTAGGGTTTWLNHWSLMHANWSALSRMDRIGFDGTFLQLALYKAGYHVHRTSADLVLPFVLHEVLPPNSSIVVVGAAPGVALQASARMGAHDIHAFDGYTELRRLRTNPDELIDISPTLILVGLGAGLQEQVASEFHEVCPDAIICTVGGWLDQLAHSEHYFPRWIHRLRLGWLWRIIHEPHRVLRRYTFDALKFSRKSRALIGRLESIGQWDEFALHPHRAASQEGQ